MTYSKCDFCEYNDRGKCLFPEYLRNPHNPETPCTTAIKRMMEIMKCDIQHRGRNVQVNKTINHRKR